MEKRLSKILKSTNTTNLIKTILDNIYEVVLGAYNLVVSTRPAFLLRAIEL